MKLHQRGIDLLVEIHTALDHVEKLSSKDLRDLLNEQNSCCEKYWRGICRYGVKGMICGCEEPIRSPAVSVLPGWSLPQAPRP